MGMGKQDWPCALAGTKGGLVPAISAHGRFQQLLITSAMGRDFLRTVRSTVPGFPVLFGHWRSLLLPSRTGMRGRVGGERLEGPWVLGRRVCSQSIRWES